METSGKLVFESVFALCPKCNQIVWGMEKDKLNSRHFDKIVSLVKEGKTIKTLPTPIRHNASKWHCTCQREFNFY